MPMTPNIIHTMKHTVKASVLTINTESACPFLVMSKTPFLHDMTLGWPRLWWYPSEGAVAQAIGTTPGAVDLVLKN
jgi:hypothetical protein